MIQNKWKTVLAQKNMTQAQAAKAAGINAPLFSMVANGTGVLAMDELQSICKVLDIEPEKVYPVDVLKSIYGVEVKKQTQRSVSIKLNGNDLALFEYVKEYFESFRNGKKLSNIEVIRELLRYAFPKSAQRRE